MLFRKRLKGKRVAVLTADGFEQVEVMVPRKALVAEGAEVDIVSLRHGKILGMNVHEPGRRLRVDRTVEELDPRRYDALFVPGGFIGPDLLRQSQRAREIVRRFDELGLPVATLCHGPWLLASADIVRGRQMTSWPGIRDDLVHAGATWRDEAVVRDENWVSSRGPQDLGPFVKAFIDLVRDPRETESARRLPMTSSPPRADPPRAVIAAASVSPRHIARGAFRVAAALAVAGLVLVASRRARTLPSFA